MVHERLLHHLLRLTQRRPPTSASFDALRPQVDAVAEAAGLRRCDAKEEAALEAAAAARQPPRPHGCVSDEDVFMVARLVDEEENLGLFSRVYPSARTHQRYERFWAEGVGVTQRLAAAWIEAQAAASGGQTGDRATDWIAQLREEDEEYARLSAAAVPQRPAPAPPLFEQVDRGAGSASGDEVHRPGGRALPKLQKEGNARQQTMTLQQQLRQRVAERCAHPPQPKTTQPSWLALAAYKPADRARSCRLCRHSQTNTRQPPPGMK